MDVSELAELLTARGKTVSVAEADTCGLVGYMLGAVPGASRFFPGGVIAYAGGLKESVLGVPEEVAANYGTVSEEMAKAMARGVRELTGTDFAVSVTGITGPGKGRSGAPIGTFFIGLSVMDGGDQAIEIHVPGDRDATKQAAAQAALDLLGRRLKGA